MEFAVPQGDSNLGRAWSKYSYGSSRHKERNPTQYQKDKKKKKEKKDKKAEKKHENKNKKKSALDVLKEKASDLENDPRFQDYLTAMVTTAHILIFTQKT